jgi:hypothetical protein
MLRKLILKDIYAYKDPIFLRIMLLWFLFGVLVIYRYFPWDLSPITMHASMTIAVAATFFSFFDKNRKTEILSSSLPVTRSMIVRARYLTSFLIILVGIVLWLIIVYLAEHIYPNLKKNYSQIFNFKILLMVLFFTVVHITLFLPAVFKFQLLGTIFSFALALVVSVIATRYVFYREKGSFNLYLETTDSYALVIIILATIISAIVSIGIYKKRDL